MKTFQYKTLQFPTRTTCCREIMNELNTWGAKGFKLIKDYLQFGEEGDEQIQLFLVKKHHHECCNKKHNEHEFKMGGCCQAQAKTCCQIEEDSQECCNIESKECCSTEEGCCSTEEGCCSTEEGCCSTEHGHHHHHGHDNHERKYLYDLSSFACSDISPELIDKELNEYGHDGFKLKLIFKFIKKDELRVRYVVMKKI